MRKTILAAGVCAALAVGSAPVPAFAQESDGLDMITCSAQYNADQLPALAAGLIIDDALTATSRSEVLWLYSAQKASLEKGLGANGWGTHTFPPVEESELGVVEDTNYTASSMSSGDIAGIAGLDGAETAYFYNASIWTQKMRGLCGKEMHVAAPAEPVSLRGEGLVLSVSAITGIVIAIVAMLGLGGAAFAGMIPGVRF